MSAELLRVMYAPLEYIHADHFAASGAELTPAVKSAVNHHLIRRFKLATALDFKLSNGDFSDRLVGEWSSVRKVAWLLGCKLARATLARNGHFTKLPESARQFVAIPLACPVQDLTGSVTQTSLEIHGARYLLALVPRLPAPLAQRLPLVFPANVGDQAWQGAMNRSLLTFAFDYAKTNLH